MAFRHDVGEWMGWQVLSEVHKRIGNDGNTGKGGETVATWRHGQMPNGISIRRRWWRTKRGNDDVELATIGH
jgi:hypothetical protein